MTVSPPPFQVCQAGGLMRGQTNLAPGRCRPTNHVKAGVREVARAENNGRDSGELNAMRDKQGLEVGMSAGQGKGRAAALSPLSSSLSVYRLTIQISVPPRS